MFEFRKQGSYDLGLSGQFLQFVSVLARLAGFLMNPRQRRVNERRSVSAIGQGQALLGAKTTFRTIRIEASHACPCWRGDTEEGEEQQVFVLRPPECPE